MKIISLLLKLIFFWIYIPYLIIKSIGGGSSSSSSSPSSPISNNTKGGIPLVTIDKSQASNFELGEVRSMNARQIQVQYKEKGGSFKKVLIDRPKNQSGPIRIDWSKTIS